MFKHLCIIATLAIGSASLAAQEKSTYNNLPSIQYPGSKYGSIYASVTEFQGAKAIVYEAAFQPHKGWGISGIVSGGKTSYFGKLYITADQVAFVPTQPKDEHLAWTMKRPQFTLAMTGDGMEIKPASKDDSTTPNGLLHFEPVENKTGKLEFSSPDEPSFLHKKKLDPPMQAFLDDLNALIATFGDTFKRLSNEAGG